MMMMMEKMKSVSEKSEKKKIMLKSLSSFHFSKNQKQLTVTS